MTLPHSWTRRSFLRRGSLALGAIGGTSFLVACSDDATEVSEPTTTVGGSEATTSTQPPTTATTPGSTSTEQAPTSAASATTESAPTALTTADFGEPTCRLTGAQAEGPYYLRDELVRRDVTEGRPGVPTHLGLLVTNADCSPIAGALVDIWHADADGDYSAYRDGSSGDEDAEGTTFLRGTQATNDAGIVEFDTIWPGWYPGRAVHIHFKVHAAGSSFTSQLYFPDDTNNRVFESADYADPSGGRVVNARDGIAGDPAANGLLATVTDAQTANGFGRRALLAVAVDL